MNYDNHPDFNKARTPEEATQQFANTRAISDANANTDFSKGVQAGLFFFVAGAVIYNIVTSAL